MYSTLLLCKILDDILSFIAPLILGDLVDVTASAAPRPWQNLASGFIARPLSAGLPHPGHVQKCVILAALLVLAATLKAVVTTQYTYHLNLMAIRAHGALMQATLQAALNMPAYARGNFSEGNGHFQYQLCP